MIPVIEGKSEELASICREFSVIRLTLFGSAAVGTFDPDRSDLDFVVELGPHPTLNHARQYFGLIDALEGLFGCSVDVLERRAIRNPVLLRTVEGQEIGVYAA